MAVMTQWHAEPVAIAAAIRSVILAAVAFGLDWKPEQIAAVMLAVEAVLAVVVRGQTTSKQTLSDAGTSRAEVQRVAADPHAVMIASRTGLDG